MATHRPHPLTGEWMQSQWDDPEDAILWDDCERCDQHANRPLVDLDLSHTAALYRRMLAVEKQDAESYRTWAEARAGGNLYRVAVWVERTHPWLDPWTWPWSPREATVANLQPEDPHE